DGLAGPDPDRRPPRSWDLPLPVDPLRRADPAPRGFRGGSPPSAGPAPPAAPGAGALQQGPRGLRGRLDPAAAAADRRADPLRPAAPTLGEPDGGAPGISPGAADDS